MRYFYIGTPLHCGGTLSTERKERLDKIRQAVGEALATNEDFIKIENPDTGKFVQVAIHRNRRLIILDVPLIELSDREVQRLRSLLNAEIAHERQTNEPISVQKLFYIGDGRKLSHIVETIFLEVFGMAHDFEVRIEIFPR